MEKHILVVLPHPDDEAFGLAGTLAMQIERGTQVTYACLTLGEMARNMGNPPFANRITLPSIRKQELEESCKAIGIQDLRLLGFHDKTIEFEDHDALDAKIEAIIKEVQPSLIVTFYPGFAVHPDHDATGAAVVRTVGRMEASVRPPVHCIAFANGHEEALGKPDIVNDVKRYMTQKMASISAHRSQFQIVSMVGTEGNRDEQMLERFGTERFYTYRFE
ncbi:bacillithiol biosynthesis deacetylase BshB2 [Cohnella yongneupensis]|uniref:Bacillithiol biosynthesis deacetylase BshB2 n=1 Tax=Cohnella yongneupensis TaxID=425006 RepID=A0ABW0QZ95_9BACL